MLEEKTKRVCNAMGYIIACGMKWRSFCEMLSSLSFQGLKWDGSTPAARRAGLMSSTYFNLHSHLVFTQVLRAAEVQRLSPEQNMYHVMN